MTFGKEEVEKGLKNKGFKEKTKGDHIFLIYYDMNGNKTSVRTKLSRSSAKDIDDSLQNLMSKQCKVKKQDFIELVKCPLSRADYEQNLRDSKIIG